MSQVKHPKVIIRQSSFLTKSFHCDNPGGIVGHHPLEPSKRPGRIDAKGVMMLQLILGCHRRKKKRINAPVRGLFYRIRDGLFELNAALILSVVGEKRCDVAQTAGLRLTAADLIL